MKIALRILVLITTAASSNSSYAFDDGRFHLGSPRPVARGVAAHVSEPGLRPAPRGVSPTGPIGGMSSAGKVNMMSSSPAGKTGAMAVASEADDPPSTVNTTYSIKGAESRSTGECGPSPMTAAQIEGLVARTAQSYGVDPDFARAIAWTESRFDRDRNSSKGARGPMQLMPATASELGVEEVCDPVTNIDGGIRHLKRMLDTFKSPILAAAAYNAGARAVHDSGGVPPFGETIRYVAAVLDHQIGPRMPRGTRIHQGVARRSSASANETASDVIGARGNRFIKGVMQF